MPIKRIPGTLRKFPQSKVWNYQVVIKGRRCSRSTGETDKRHAEKKIPELYETLRLLYEQPTECNQLSGAIVQEVARVEADVSANHALRVSSALENFLKWIGRDVPLDYLTTEMLEEYQRQRFQKGRATNTIKKETDYILRMLVRSGFRIARPQALRKKREAYVREFTHDELKRFFKALDALKGETQAELERGEIPVNNFTPLSVFDDLRCLFLALLSTGARPAELRPSDKSNHAALLKKEIHFAEGIVHIRSAKMSEGHRSSVRRIKVDDHLLALLDSQCERTKGNFVFPVLPNLFRYFNRVLQAADISKVDDLGEKLTAHSFRHTYATLMAQKVQGDPLALQHALGHSQISTTGRYVHNRTPAQIIDVQEFCGPRTDQSGNFG